MNTKLTNDDPELPEHNEGTSNTGRSHLSRVDGDSSVLGANTNTHNEARCEETLPRLRTSGTNRGDGKSNGSNEDFTASAKIFIKGVDDECTTIEVALVAWHW